MPFNGSGTFTVYTPGNPVVTGTTISSTWANNTLSDIATGLTTCLTKDGQTTATANIPFGGFQLLNVGSATARTRAPNLGQVQDSGSQLVGTVAGTNTITGVMTPSITAYALGQTFRIIPAVTNTGATTLNIDGVGAKDVKKNSASGYTALVAGDLVAGNMYEIVYDTAGTDEFVVLNPGTADVSGLTADRIALVGTGGALTDSADFTYTLNASGGNEDYITIGGATSYAQLGKNVAGGGSTYLYLVDGAGLDAKVTFQLASGVNWAIGADNSASDSFVLSKSTTLGTDNYLSVDTSGVVSLPIGQLAFPSVQNASANPNTLDDYDESTPTIELTFATAGDLSVTYSTQAAVATKIGRSVTVQFILVTSAFTHTTASGNLQLTGFPFTSSASTAVAQGSLTFGGITKANYTNFCVHMPASNTVANVFASGSGVAASLVTAADMPTGGSVTLRGTITYTASA